MRIDLGTIVADAHEDDPVGKSRTFADALAVDDHEALRGLVCVDMHRDLECGQIAAFGSRKIGQSW